MGHEKRLWVSDGSATTNWQTDMVAVGKSPLLPALPRRRFALWRERERKRAVNLTPEEGTSTYAEGNCRQTFVSMGDHSPTPGLMAYIWNPIRKQASFY